MRRDTLEMELQVFVSHLLDAGDGSWVLQKQLFKSTYSVCKDGSVHVTFVSQLGYKYLWNMLCTQRYRINVVHELYFTVSVINEHFG